VLKEEPKVEKKEPIKCSR